MKTTIFAFLMVVSIGLFSFGIAFFFSRGFSATTLRQNHAATATALTIQNGSTATITLSDASTITLRFAVAADGTTTAEGALGRDEWFCPVINAGISPAPPAPPIPTPPTPPTPTPTPTGKFAALIGVVAQAGSRTGNVWQGPTVTAAVTAAGGNVFCYSTAEVADPTTPDLDLRWIGQAYAAAGAKLPWLFAVDASGNVLWQGVPPATEAALVTILQPIIGGTKTAEVPAAVAPVTIRQSPACSGSDCPYCRRPQQ